MIHMFPPSAHVSSIVVLPREVSASIAWRAAPTDDPPTSDPERGPCAPPGRSTPMMERSLISSLPAGFLQQAQVCMMILVELFKTQFAIYQHFRNDGFNNFNICVLPDTFSILFFWVGGCHAKFSAPQSVSGPVCCGSLTCGSWSAKAIHIDR